MPREVKIEAVKTYATHANAVAAVEKRLGARTADLRYFVMRSDDGRFFPVFIGQAALGEMVHFHFNVIA